MKKASLILTAALFAFAAFAKTEAPAAAPTTPGLVLLAPTVTVTATRLP